MLKSLLDSNPHVYCEGEVLHELHERMPHPLLAQVIRFYPFPYMEWRRWRCARGRVYGCKLMDFNLPSRGLRVFAQQFAWWGWRIIHLRRSDVLRQCLSNEIAKVTGRFQRRVGELTHQGLVRLEPVSVLNELRYRTRHPDFEELTSLPIPRLELNYEEDLAHPDCWSSTVRKATDFLGLPYHPPSTQQQRSYERPLDKVVENFSEVIAAIENSPYAYTLEAMRLGL